MNASSLDTLIRTAITGKRLLRVRYDGRDREVEPHDYGVQRGIERLLVNQLRGTPRTRGRSATGWRLLALPNIEDCEVLIESFAGSRGVLHSRRWFGMFSTCAWIEAAGPSLFTHLARHASDVMNRHGHGLHE